MKRQRLFSLAWALVLGPLTGWSATSPAPLPPVAAAPVDASEPPADAKAKLSPPVRGVAEMVEAGVSDDLVRAYIEDAPTVFSLAPDDIIRLQLLGISPSLTIAMLSHDRAVRSRMGPPPEAQVAPQPPPGPAGETAPAATAPLAADDSALYSNLSPYGSWSDVPGYGYAWQPYGWVNYNYYPWYWLGFGYWWNCPGHGWCWFPHSHSHGSSYYHGGYGHSSYSHNGQSSYSHTGQSSSTHASAAHSAYGGSHAAGTANTAGVHGPAVNSHASAPAHGSSPWASRSFAGAGFRSGTGGFQSVGGGGFHGAAGVGSAAFHGSASFGGGGFHGGGGGGGGGFHGGGGGGGSHGGGGHR